MKARERHIIDLHAVGLSDKQIAEEVGGVSRDVVRKTRKKFNLPFNPSPAAPAKKRIDREYLAREFDETMKALQSHGDHAGVLRQVRRVAAELGVNYDNLIKVYSYQMGLVKRQPVRRYTDEQYAEAKRLLDDHGLSYTEVERQTGIPRDRLGHVLPGRGLSPSEAQTVRWVNVHMRKMGI